MSKSSKPRRIVRWSLTAVAVVVLPVGAYFGPSAAAHAFADHTTPERVSYATQDTIDRTIAGAWHTPAQAGDFIPAVALEDGHVESAVVVVP